jgi:hypothetical protein
MLNTEVIYERLYNASVDTHAQKALRIQSKFDPSWGFGSEEIKSFRHRRHLSRPTHRSSTLVALLAPRCSTPKRWALHKPILKQQGEINAFNW